MESWVFLPECRNYINLSSVEFIDECSSPELTLLFLYGAEQVTVTDPRTRALIHEFLGRNLVRFEQEATT